jgi:hypothetical protein
MEALSPDGGVGKYKLFPDTGFNDQVFLNYDTMTILFTYAFHFAAYTIILPSVF